MATSDIALEKVQALLKVDTRSGSLHGHLARVVRALAAERPVDALAQLETLSRHVKQATFRGALAPDEAQDIVLDAVAEERRRQWCQDALRLVRPPSDPTAAPKVLCAVQNFLEDAAMFEWAGVGFSKQESFHIALSLRKLAAEVPALERLRLWGKVLGTGGDYYVAEGTLKQPEGAAPAEPALPGTPEYDVEPHGEGANTWAYWVSAGGTSPWVRLPAARASHIVAARSIKRLLTGNLGSPVVSTPWFPGKERHLLRSQIARITASCTLSVKGWYDMEEDPDGKKTMKQVDGAEFPPPEELKTEAGWSHCAPFLLATGKSSYPDMEKLEALAGEGGINEDIVKELQKQQEKEAAHEMLEGIEEDLSDLKPEGAEVSPGWSIKVHGDQGAYTAGGERKAYCVTAVRSMIWPGAVTVAQGSKFANLYVGYGLKCNTLVPLDKDGLPLGGTSPFLPLVPEDIMNEPDDLSEQGEPNPQDDDAGSVGEDFDNGDDDE